MARRPPPWSMVIRVKIKLCSPPSDKAMTERIMVGQRAMGIQRQEARNCAACSLYYTQYLQLKPCTTC